MRSKDDLSQDLEASDIISQISSDVASSEEKIVIGNAIKTEWGDPWSSDPWKNPTNPNQISIESSFESLQFTPVLKTTGESDDLLDVADAFGISFGHTNDSRVNDSITITTPPSIEKTKFKIGIVVEERLSIIFDEATNDPVCRVIGNVYVEPTMRNMNSFSLTIRDKKTNVEHWDERNNRCRNITASVPHLALDPGDQVFSISLKREQKQDMGLDSPVISYTCNPRLRPMPMLLKTKTHQANGRCRLGVRIRANPQNQYILRDVVILVIVPLGLDGESVTMSRRGGIWDELKRSLVWVLPELDAGEIIDIQAQFKSNKERGPNERNLDYYKFPVLAKCNGDMNFSKIDLNTDYSEDGSIVEIDLKRSATVLYRKI